MPDYRTPPGRAARSGKDTRKRMRPVRVAHFVQRYPPALGGAEAYFARLGRYLAAAGDRVTVFTTNVIDLENFFSTRGASLRPGRRREDGVEVRRYGLRRLPF